MVVLAAVILTVILLSSGGSKSKTSPPAGPGFTTFRDARDGFTLNYPSIWTVGQTADTQVPLLLQMGTEALDTLLVRVNTTQQAIDTSNIANIKAFTDGVISGTGVTVLKQQAISINGLPGYFYFYTFTDKPSGTTLAHSHYFFFPPHQMVSLVFQALTKDFAVLAPTFDQVVATLRALPASSSTSTP